MKVRNQHLLLTIVVLLLAVSCRNGTSLNDDIAAAEIHPAGESNTSETQPTEKPEATPEPTPVDATPGDIGLGDPFFPEEGNGGYDVQHYDLELSVDVEAHQIAGVVTIDAMATEALNSFNLDFEEFEISELLVDDVPAEFRQEDDELTIIPAEPLPAKENFTVQIAYSGNPTPRITEGDSFRTGWFWQVNGSYVASEPFGSQTWYPVNDHPLDKATYSFRITVPKPLVVAANGTLKETIDVGESTTYIWEAHDPMASYLATVNIGDFVLQSDETEDGLPIANFFPSRRVKSLTDAFSSTAEMITFFSGLFGPYPFESYGAIVLDSPGGFALETQTRSLFPYTMAREAVIVHELAHQWFGNDVSLEKWQDMWLKEGFATYAEWIWHEHTKGEETADGFIATKHKAMSAAAELDSYVQPGQPSIENLYARNVYEGGAMVLHALRLQVGDDAFFKILRTYAERYRFGNASTEDFIALAEEVSEQDLEDFFNSWLYSNDVPDLAESRSD